MAINILKAANLKRAKDWRVIIYSKPGVGKTTAVKYMPGKTLVLDLDDSSRVLAGQPKIDVIKFDRVHPEEFWIDFLKQAKDLTAGYDNLVVDNVTSFERDWFVEKGRNSKNGISNEIQDYGQWTNYFARIMTSIYMLNNVNILTTAWETQQQITTDEGQTFNQYAPAIRDSVRDGLLGLADVVGRMVVNPKTGGRGVILQGSDGIYAKNRLDNRTLVSIEDLFKLGSEKRDVPTPPVPDGPGEQGPAKPGDGPQSGANS